MGLTEDQSPYGQLAQLGEEAEKSGSHTATVNTNSDVTPLFSELVTKLSGGEIKWPEFKLFYENCVTVLKFFYRSWLEKGTPYTRETILPVLQIIKKIMAGLSEKDEEQRDPAIIARAASVLSMMDREPALMEEILLAASRDVELEFISQSTRSAAGKYLQ